MNQWWLQVPLRIQDEGGLVMHIWFILVYKMVKQSDDCG